MQIFLIDLMLVIFGGVGIYYGIQYKSQLVLAINIFVSNNTLTNLISYFTCCWCCFRIVLWTFHHLQQAQFQEKEKAFWVLASAPITVDTHLISRIFACQVLHFATATIVILLQ